MKTIKNFISLLFAMAMLVSCNKVTYRKTAGGMPYQLYPGKGTQKIYAGNIVKYNVIYKVKDSVFFSSFGKLPAYMPVNQVAEPYDISEVWTKLKVGDSVVTTQMMDTFIKRSPQNIPPRFKKGDRIITYLKVLDVFLSDSAMTVDEEKEKKKFLAGEIDFLEKYLANQNIKTEKTPSGAFVQIINPGAGNLIDSGKYVSVKYTGTSFSGKRFDSNTDSSFHHMEPLSFTVNGNQMMKGFDEAMMLLRPGSSAKVYIPSLLGYGPNPDPRTGIKPFEHLIFDIVVTDVKDKAPEQKPEQRPKKEIKVDAAQPKK